MRQFYVSILAVKATLDHVSSNDEPHSLAPSFTAHSNGDGIAISPDGTNWYLLTNLTSTFASQEFDIDAAIQSAGISYTSDFRIKFQQYDNYPWSTDGRSFDNITVTSSSPVLLAHWKLDDNGSDTTVCDSSDCGNHGIARRTTCTIRRPGVIGDCLDFDGTGDCIDIPDSPHWCFGDFTITLWVQFDSFNAKWWESAFVGQDEGGGLRNKWIFSYCPTSGKTLLHINGPGIGGHILTGGQWTAQTGAWYFVGLTRNGDTYTFYRQGVPDGSQINSIALPDVSSPLTIGWAEGPGKFNGAIDDVRIYCEALTALEVEEICDEGPSAHWKMDDNAASKTVVDIIGRGCDGTARENTQNLTVSGMLDNALSFDGTTDYISVPERLEWVLAVDFTISLWVKYDAFNSNWWESAFVAQDQGGGKQNKWIFSYDPTSERTLFHINGPGSTGPVITGDQWTAEAGRWYFIAISRSSDGTYNFYRQGAANGSEVNPEPTPDVSGPWTIGWAEGPERFDGTIDDVRVYNRVLSQAEILDLYEDVISPSATAESLLGHWTMDDNASNPSVQDSSGIGNHATARRNTSDLSTPGIISTALDFDGATDYVSVPDQAAWSFPGDFTIALWVKYDSFNVKWWESAFVAQDAGGGPTRKWIFSYCPTSEKTLFHINGPGTGAPILTGNQWSAQTDTWYFVGVARSGNTYTFYRQGIPDGSQVDSTALPDVSSPLTIGWAEGPRRFDGAIDDVRIYNGALSPAKIQGLYNTAAGL